MAFLSFLQHFGFDESYHVCQAKKIKLYLPPTSSKMNGAVSTALGETSLWRYDNSIPSSRASNNSSISDRTEPFADKLRHAIFAQRSAKVTSVVSLVLIPDTGLTNNEVFRSSTAGLK